MKKPLSFLSWIGIVCFSLFFSSFVAVAQEYFLTIEFENLQSGERKNISKHYEDEKIMLSEKVFAIGVKIGEHEIIEISDNSGEVWKKFIIDVDEKLTGENFDSQLIYFPQGIDSFQFRTAEDSHVHDTGQEGEEEIDFFFLGDQSRMESVASTQNIILNDAEYEYDKEFFAYYNIIPRAQWGADESLRYQGKIIPSTPSVSRPLTQVEIGCEKIQAQYPEDFIFTKRVSSEAGKTLKWQYRYSPQVRKIAVHHTASNAFTDRNLSAEEVMRSTYSYHTTGRGWGDIGYNFVISPDGKIFEGRAGGDYVVGGHIYCANVQTIGVSLMGDFTSKDPTEAQTKALQSLLGGLAKKYNLDTSAESSFHGKFSYNVIGHRDYGQTACPGDHVYELLPFIREGIDLSSLAFGAKKLLSRAALFIGKVDIKTISQGKKERYTLEFKNTGDSVWDSSTWLFADFPSTDISIVPLDGKSIFYAASLNELSVLPGQIGTFNVDIVAGSDTGLHTIEFTPVVDSRRITKSAIVLPVLTENATFSTAISSFTTQLSADKKVLDLSLSFKNTGNILWLKQNNLLKVQLGNEIKFFRMKESEVSPLEIATFVGQISVEQKQSLLFSASLTNQQEKIATGGTITKKIFPLEVFTSSSSEILSAEFSEGRVINTRMKKGSLPQKYFVAINTGNTTWKRSEITMNVSYGKDEWVLQMLESEVKAGETATFFLQAPEEIIRTQRYTLQIVKGVKKLRGGKIRWYVRLDRSDFTLNPVIVAPQVITPTIDVFELEAQKQNQAIINSNIRIRLSYPHQTAKIEGRSLSIFIDGKELKGLDTVFNFEQIGDMVSVNGVLGKVIRIYSKRRDTPVELTSWYNIPEWNTSLNDNLFLGTLEFRIYNNELIVINDINIEDYLRGLGEVSDSAPLEKQKAIALVARSYAQFYMSDKNRKYPNAPYDGDDSPASFQKYLGYGYTLRSPNFSKAVNATTGEIITYNGELVKTPFFSESDGRTRSAQEVWGWTTTPYLVSVDDTICKNGQGSLQGHGVGLSGCGATQLALDGKTYKEILNYYFKGIELR